MKTVIGMDLGGTKLLLGELDGNGSIRRERSVPSGPLDQQGALSLMKKALTEFLADASAQTQPAAVGIGLVGRIDSRLGLWHEIDRERSEPLALAAEIEKHCGLPCYIDNDVRSAARAELLFGEGRRSRNFAYINVGTGVAAGIVIDGRLLHGAHCNAGELGHSSSGLALGVSCACGRKDCVEAIASGMGLDRRARQLLRSYPGSSLKPPEDGRIRAGDIFRLSDADELCALLTDDAASALATLVMDLVRFCDPDCVVLGGGVAADGFLLEKMKEKLNAHTIRFLGGGVRLTELDGNRIGLLGAACNAWEGMRGNI